MDQITPDGGPAAPGRLALLLNAEIASVITAMRANAKWAVVPSKYNVRLPLYRGARGLVVVQT